MTQNNAGPKMECPYCAGTGKAKGNPEKDCYHCDGTGEQDVTITR